MRREEIIEKMGRILRKNSTACAKCNNLSDCGECKRKYLDGCNADEDILETIELLLDSNIIAEAIKEHNTKRNEFLIDSLTARFKNGEEITETATFTKNEIIELLTLITDTEINF